MTDDADKLQTNSSPHAYLGNDEADHAGPFFSTAKISLSFTGLEETEALKALQTHGYYRFRRYWLALEKSEDTPDIISISRILDVMRFDEEMANLILSMTSPVEIAFRSSMQQALDDCAGDNALGQASLFKSAADHERATNILIREKANAGKRNDGPYPCEIEADKEPPTWLMLEFASLGTLSKIYGNLKSSEIRNAATKPFGVKPYILENWMRCATIARNVCAHNGRLYEQTFKVRPALFKEHAGIDRTRFFSYLLVLMRLHAAVRPDEAHTARIRLRRITEEHPDLNLAHWGFPENWKEVLGIPTRAATGPRPRGLQGGRPPKDPAAIEEALYLYDLKTDSIAEISRKTGVGPTTLYKYIKLRNEQPGSDSHH